MFPIDRTSTESTVTTAALVELDRLERALVAASQQLDRLEAEMRRVLGDTFLTLPSEDEL